MFKKISDYPNYSVSDDGQVRWDKANRLLHPMVSTSGYYYVQFCDADNRHRTKYVHGLVAEAFIDRPEGTTQVDHINGDKLDNRVENLRWVTVAENAKAYGAESRKENRKRCVLATHIDGTQLLFSSRLATAKYFNCDTSKIAYGKLYVRSDKKGWKFEKLVRTSSIVPIDTVLGDEPIVVTPSSN